MLGRTSSVHSLLDVYVYNLNISFAADCVDLCQGVSCDDGDPCTSDLCDPVNGQCEHMPVTGTCGSSNAGRCIQGMCIVEVQMNVSASGDSVCAAQGLTCSSIPVLAPPEAACIAFNPGASVSTDLNGWKQSVYCNNNMGLACQTRTNDCHNCPQCNDTGLDCATSTTTQIEKIYAYCI